MQTRSRTRAHAHAHAHDTQNIAETVNVINSKTAMKIKRVLHLLAHIYGCKCPKRQKETHTQICQQKTLNSVLFGDLYKTHDITPQHQSLFELQEDQEAEEAEEAQPEIELDDTLDEDPNTSHPTSPHTPVSEGETIGPFPFPPSPVSPIPHYDPLAIPEEGETIHPDQTLPDSDPVRETDSLRPDSSDTSISVEFRTADSAEEFDATIEFITEQLENIVAQREHELRKAVSKEEVGQIVARTQAQALQLKNHILLLEAQKKQFDPRHTSSPAPQKPRTLLQQIDKLLFDRPHTRGQGPPPFGLLPPKPKPPPKPRKQ